jgi:xanthine dehydrogenase YagS FAD-binding subunit
MSRDMMPHFELYQPDTLENAIDLAKRIGPDAWFLAGGHDSLDWFKDRVKRPKAVIEIAGIKELAGLRETADGLEIGALTKLVEIENSPLVREKYSLLSTAAGRVASPQIRNAGTLGGNLCQDTRCWYYRYGVSCYRAGGITCYADTPQGQNREHCLFGASRCVAVSPSDLATASVTLDAKMVIRGPGGERVVPAEEFFIGPAKDITRMTALEQGEVLTAVRYPKTWAGATFYFEKVTDRNTWDFALVSVAAAMFVEDGTIKNIRLACGAVECVPRRLTAVERSLIGTAKNEESAVRAGKMAIEGATALTYNHFKMPLMENLVRRAIRDA